MGLTKINPSDIIDLSRGHRKGDRNYEFYYYN